VRSTSACGRVKLCTTEDILLRDSNPTKWVFIASLSVLSACQPTETLNPQHVFFDRFLGYCGQSFAAHIVEDDQPSDAWNQPLVVHIRDCETDTLRMPLHVGDDRSRTWVLQRTEKGLNFQHIHLHEDGSADAVSPYGGHTAENGTESLQSFPVDAASKTLFEQNGLAVSTQNTWRLGFPSADTMSYELTRPNRSFIVHVDLSQPIAEPPPAWGYLPSAK
jgi:hypothetical protein